MEPPIPNENYDRARDPSTVQYLRDQTANKNLRLEVNVDPSIRKFPTPSSSPLLAFCALGDRAATTPHIDFSKPYECTPTRHHTRVRSLYCRSRTRSRFPDACCRTH